MTGRRRWGALAATATSVVVAAGVAISSAPDASAAISGNLFRDPDSQVMRWLAASPGDSRATLIRDRIASQSQARWFARYNPDTITSEVAAYVNQANAADSIPVLVAYALPDRDCGGASAGGAPNFASYQTWIQRLAQGLGSRTAIVILEPDSLALQTCLSAGQVAERNKALAAAARSIKQANPAARVYLDAGHSAWNGPVEQARRLDAAGVKTAADGFATNVSNFRRTADEVAYGKAILGQLGASHLRFVVDTSRNGNGPRGSEWCDPAGRAIGQAPTVNTGDAVVDAFLWIKPPGESDGCAAGAGTFLPGIAYELARNAPNPPPPPTSPTASPSPSPSTVPTSSPTSPPPTSPAPTASPTGGAAACAVSYRVDAQWANGFTATVTITNTGGPINGWSLAFTFPGNQRITNAWNGRPTANGQQYTVRDGGHNASVPTGGTAGFGFQGEYSGTNSAPRDFTLNGSPCTLR